MPTQVTLIYTDAQGPETRAVVRSPRFRIGRAPDNDLVVADTNLSRHHAQIELVGDAAFVSDLGSQNGTALNGERVTASAELRDGDALTLAGARRFTVRIEQSPAAPFASTYASASPRSATETRASGSSNVPNALSYATPGAASFAGGAAQPSSGPAQSTSNVAQSRPAGRPAWLNPIIIAPVAAVLLLLVAGGALFAFKHSRGASGDAGEVDPLESASAQGGASKSGEAGAKKIGGDASAGQTTGARATASGDAASGASGGTTGAGGPAAGASQATSSGASPPSSDADDLSRDIKRVMSRISNDSAPYISEQGIRDVTAKVRQYRGSSPLRDRLRAAQRECADVSALAQKSSLNPTLLMYASIAEGDSGAGDPAAVARQMTPKLTLLSATFGTATANSSLLLIAAYPYPFDPAVGTQQRNPHPLATKLVQYGGSRDVTDPSVARTVWYLREKDAVSPEAYDLVVRLLAVGVVSENPARFGVDSPPLLC